LKLRLQYDPGFSGGSGLAAVPRDAPDARVATGASPPSEGAALKSVRPVAVAVIPSHVLVPLDGSPLADDALEHALETFDCRVTVLNVVTPMDGGMSEGAALTIDGDRLDEADERATELVEAARRRADSVDRPVETVVETGDPAETILAYVEANDVDFIVMGSHGGGGGEMRRRLLGTVSTAVIGDASTPVTIIR
jgi:nucleotide-binding universal stress UspA family protein